MTNAGVRLGQYKYPGEDSHVEFWYQCKSRKCDVYLHFEQPLRSIQEIKRAMEYACRLQATGVTITRTKPNAEGSPFDIKTDFRVCQFKPYHPQFNSDVNPVIKYEDLVPRPDSRLASNIQVVTFENQLFVHKFMSEESEQCEFEAEVERYQMLKGCEGVPEFRGVVRRQGLLQGFLISYIEGDN